MFATFLSLALIFFLLCMFLVDTLQVLLRAISAVMDAPVLGAHLGSIFMLINRAATALALLVIGYLVDIALPSQHLVAIYAASSLLIAATHLPLLRRAPLLNLTLMSFRRIYSKTCSPEMIQKTQYLVLVGIQCKISPAVVSVTALGFFGLLSPSLLASTFHDYRTTFMQTGFILNSVASIINVMQVERKFALVMDSGSPEQINSLYSSYTVSRCLGYLLAAMTFVFVLACDLFLSL